jgi:hypothetical protein
VRRLQTLSSQPTRNQVFLTIFGTRSAHLRNSIQILRGRGWVGNWGFVLAHQPVAERKNESAPNSFESWDARSNSPPPKSAHNQLTSGAGVWEWLRSATGSFRLKSHSYSRKQMSITSGRMIARLSLFSRFIFSCFISRSRKSRWRGFLPSARSRSTARSTLLEIAATLTPCA